MKRNFTKQDFYDLLEPNGDCLEWKGLTHEKGYGRTYFNGRVEKTHRLALILEGIDVSGKHVLHSCDNPSCCNPAHLRVGTNYENSLDMVNRGRQRIQKLSVDDVIQIKQLLKQRVKQQVIADMFGVGRCTITQINLGKSWSHITLS